MAPQGHFLDEKTFEELEHHAVVEKVERGSYVDIFSIHFSSGAFRPGSFSDELGDWKISHVSFDENMVEYTKQE